MKEKLELYLLLIIVGCSPQVDYILTQTPLSAEYVFTLKGEALRAPSAAESGCSGLTATVENQNQIATSPAQGM